MTEELFKNNEEYQQYKKETSMLLPWRTKRDS